MLSFTLVLLTQIGSPQGVHLLDPDDLPLLAQVAPPLVPSEAPVSETQVSAEQLQVDMAALKKQRPGLGGPITLISVGGGAAIVGGLYLAIGSISAFRGALSLLAIIGGVAMGIGLPLLVLGVWMLYNRIEERLRIDTEMKSLKLQLQQRVSQPPPRQYTPPPLQNIPAPQVRGPDASMLLARFD